MSRDIKIIGVDEVGRGCVAGPIVCASFALKLETLIAIKNSVESAFSTKNKPTKQKQLNRFLFLINYDINSTETRGDINLKNTTNFDLNILSLVNDSKKVTKLNRIKVVNYIIKNFLNFGIGSENNLVIDKKGISYANKSAMRKSLSINLKNTNYYNIILSDHLNPFKSDKLDLFNTKIINKPKMDGNSFVTAVASIIAKEYRDLLMGEYHNKYINYDFNKNVGYGTKQHLESIKKHGICKIHRKSFLMNYL